MVCKIVTLKVCSASYHHLTIRNTWRDNSITAAVLFSSVLIPTQPPTITPFLDLLFLSVCTNELLLEHEIEQEKIWKKYATVDIFSGTVVMEATDLPTTHSLYTIKKWFCYQEARVETVQIGLWQSPAVFFLFWQDWTVSQQNVFLYHAAWQY